MYTRPSNGIMTSFPTLDGNQISSDEEKESDPYIGVAYGSTYWNKGGVRLLPQYLHLASSTGHSNMSQHTMEGLNSISKWPTKMADITIRIQVIPDP